MIHLVIFAYITLNGIRISLIFLLNDPILTSEHSFLVLCSRCKTLFIVFSTFPKIDLNSVDIYVFLKIQVVSTPHPSTLAFVSLGNVFHWTWRPTQTKTKRGKKKISQPLSPEGPKIGFCKSMPFGSCKSQGKETPSKQT